MSLYAFPQSVRNGFVTHHGVSDLDAFASAGVSERQRRKLVASGIIEPIARGVYLSGTAGRSELALATAACLANTRLVVGGPSAGRIWGLRRLPRFEGVVHLLGQVGSQPLSAGWARVFRCGLQTSTDVTSREDGIRLTNPPITGVHLARFLGDDDLASVIEQLLHKFCTIGTLMEVADRFAGPRRPWAQRFARIVNERTEGAAAESHGEHRVFEALRRSGLPVIERQRWLQLPNGGRARLDIVDENVRWGVEIDLHPDHETRSGVAADKERDRQCHLLGWQIERVSPSDILRFDRTIAELVELHRAREQSLRVTS